MRTYQFINMGFIKKPINNKAFRVVIHTIHKLIINITFIK